MTDHSSLESKIEALSKKIDNQARFTRGVILLCTSAVLAAVFYTVTEALTTLPTAVMSLSENIGKVARLHSDYMPRNKAATSSPGK